MAPHGSRSSSGGHSSANTSGPPSPGRTNDVWDLSMFRVPKPAKNCIFWCNHCPPGLRRFMLWAWLSVGFAVAVTACVLIIHSLKVNRHTDLSLECRNRANVLQSELRSAGDQALMYLGFVLTLQGNLSQANFQMFGETTLSGRFLLGRIAYLIRVTNAERPLYDNASFPFTQYAPNSTTIQVPRDIASEYALVQYTAQVPIRSNIFGLDLAADPGIAAALDNARDTGQVQYSEPRTLYNGLRGFVIVYPVYNPMNLPANASVQTRRTACVGYVYAQANVETLATNVFANFTNDQIELRVYDVTTAPPSFDTVLYAPQFSDGNLSSTTQLDAGTNISSGMLPNWKPDEVIPLNEQNRTYSVQCRRLNPGNARIALTGVGYGILIMFVVLMLGLTLRISFKRMEGMEKEAARMHTVSERLSMAKSAAEAADTAKGRFLATVSHEIRTPLNGVLGCMSLLLDTPLNDVQLDYVRTARASGKALVALVNDVLDLSKVEAGAMELECEPFDLRSLIEDVLGMFSSTTREKGLELAGLVREGVPETVVGDAGRIRQVLINLLGNAVKFTQKGSIFVCVWAAHVPKRPALTDSERVGPSVTWVSKPELEASGEGLGASLRRSKVPFGSPSILEETEHGISKRIVGGSFREDEGRRVSKSYYFGSFRLGRSARFADPPERPPLQNSILKPAGALGNSSRFKHVTINIPDPAGDDPIVSEARGGVLDGVRSGSFSHKLKLTLSGLARGALFPRGGEHEEGSPKKATTAVPASAAESDNSQRSRRKSFEVYDRGVGRSSSMRRDFELATLKEIPESGSRDPLIEEKEGSSAKGGQKSLSISPSDLAGEELEQRIFLRVEDTGPGVSPAVQSKLFRPFQQADSSTSRKFGGTGIGLVISERLVTLMGGSMMAWSELETGTTFQFDIHMPAVDAAPPTPSSGGQSPIAGDHRNTSPTAPSELEGARAIVIQDEEVRREIVASVLQRMQMRVVGVRNCQEALELALDARAQEADRAAHGISPEPSPRGFKVLRQRLTKSGISSMPGVAGSMDGKDSEKVEPAASGQNGEVLSLTKEMLERAGPSENMQSRLLQGVDRTSSGGGEGLGAADPGYLRLESRASVSSSSSGGSEKSAIAEQGRLPSLRLWGVDEANDGEDKDVEKIIAEGERALQAAAMSEGSNLRVKTPRGNVGTLLGGGVNAEAPKPEIEQVSLSNSGSSEDKSEGRTPTFSETSTAPPTSREPFGRAPPDDDGGTHSSITGEDKDALQDAARGGPFRLILVDLDSVGKVSALEFAKQVKDDPRLADLIVVSMCVGGQHNQDNGPEPGAAEAGLLGPVYKPLRRGALAAVLHNAMHPEGGQLPRSPPSEETTQAGASSSLGKVKLDGKKILVVDDVAINVKVASRMLAALKCDVLTASSGQEAIDIFRREGGTLELVLMDVQMPEMDGFEATQKIREIQVEAEAQGAPKQRLPILALTADVMSGTKEECMKAGMDGYLPKPLNPKKLKELIYEFLGSD